MNTDKEKQEKAEHDAVIPFVFFWAVFLFIAAILLGAKLFFGLVALYAAKETVDAGDRELKKARQKFLTEANKGNEANAKRA